MLRCRARGFLSVPIPNNTSLAMTTFSQSRHGTWTRSRQSPSRVRFTRTIVSTSTQLHDATREAPLYPSPNLEPSFPPGSLFFLYYLLSPTTTPTLLTSRYPVPICASYIVSLYTQSLQQGNTLPLTSENLSRLIHLFGSLALPPTPNIPLPSSLEPHPFVESNLVLLDITPVQLGRFLQQLLVDVEQDGALLSEVDQYWCLRVFTACLGAPASSDKTEFCDLAHQQYLALSHSNEFRVHQLGILGLNHFADVHLTSIACRQLCEVIEDTSLDGGTLLDLAKRCISAPGGEVWVERMVEMWKQRMLAQSALHDFHAEDGAPPSLSIEELREMFRLALSGAPEECFLEGTRSLCSWVYSETMDAISFPASSSSHHPHSATACRNFKELLSLPNNDLPSMETTASTASAWTILTDLHELEKDPHSQCLSLPDISELYHHWLYLERRGSIPPSVQRTVTLAFIRLAGVRMDAQPLGLLAAHVGQLETQPLDTLSLSNPLLRSKRVQTAPGGSLAVEWAVAEASLGSVQWDTLLQSLRNVKLLNRRTANPKALTSFASLLIQRLSKNHPHQAFELIKHAAQFDVVISPTIIYDLCSLAIQLKWFDIAVELLERLTEIVDDRLEDVDHKTVDLLGSAVRAMSLAGVVTLPEETAKRWGRIQGHPFAMKAMSLAEEDDLRHWEWHSLILVRSMQYPASVEVFKSLANASSSPSREFVTDLVETLCHARQFRLAFSVSECLSLESTEPRFFSRHTPSPSARSPGFILELDRTIYRAAAKAGSHNVVETMWARLNDDRKHDDGSQYVPTPLEKILRHYGKRHEWRAQGSIPQSLFVKTAEDDAPSTHLRAKMVAMGGQRKAADNIITGKLLLTPEAKEARHEGKEPKSSSIEPLGGSSNVTSTTVAFNALLSSALVPHKKEPRSKIYNVRQVFEKYKSMASRADGRLRPFEPDRITLNILVKGLLSVPSLNVASVQWLFDLLIGSGYPSGSTELIDEDGKGKVFGTSQQSGTPFGIDTIQTPKLTPAPRHGAKGSSGTRKPVDLDLLSQRTTIVKASQRLRQAISFQNHIEPLYKMFIKAFYQRGDTQSARKVLYMYKELKEGYMLRVEKRQRKSWLARGLGETVQTGKQGKRGGLDSEGDI